MWKFKKKLTTESIVGVSEQMSHLLKNGIPLVEGWDLLVQQEVLPLEIGRGIVERVMVGESLSTALSANHFPALFVSFIRIAEEHGDLAYGFECCLRYYQQQEEFRQEVIQACIYPLVVLSCIMLALVFMITVILPRFIALYDSLGIALPRLTKAIIVSASLFDELLYSLLLVVLIISALLFFQPHRREQLMILFSSLPGIRALYRYRYTHYFALQLGSLLQSGVPLLRSLELIEKLSPWFKVAQAIRKVREELVQGNSLQVSLTRSDASLFLSILPRLVAIGERTGYLDKTLLHVAQTMERAIKLKLQKYVKGIEPLLIFLLGIAILIVIVSLFLPMLQLVQAV